MELTDRHRDGGIDEIPLPLGAPGRMWLCGKHVVGPDPERAMQRVGANHIVCLVQRHELDDRFPAYVEWLRQQPPDRALWFPVPDLDAPAPERTAALIGHVLSRLEVGDGVIVHCAAGIGRSGTTAVAVLLHLGMDLPRALAHVRANRPMAGPEVGAQLALVQSIAVSIGRSSGDGQTQS